MIMNKNLFPGEGYADPHAVVVEDKVYLFCGRDRDAKIEDCCRMPKWTIVSSTDLVNWKVEADILPTQTYIGKQDNCWAGHIVKKDDTFYWYFSNKNYDTGVMTSKSPTGPFVDALNKPLIPKGLAPTNSYDPCVYEEDGKYTIFFGAGIYYCVELNDDMISLKGEPERIFVVDDKGEHVGMGDKSTVFKRGDKYYLACGDRYAMADKLKGPYTLAGHFVEGGHNDYFKFKGKEYLSFEHHDTNVFFRGIAVTELEFNEDGTLLPQEEEIETFFDKRTWDFSESAMHWYLTDGTDAKHSNGAVEYTLNEFIGFRNPCFPNFKTDKNYKFIIELEKGIEAKMKLHIDSVASPRAYVKDADIFTKIIPFELSADKNVYEIEVEQNEFRVFKRFSMFALGQEDQGVIRIKRITLTK